MNQNPIIGQSLLHYRIFRKPGSGGMGLAYEAEDFELGRRVALKFLPLEMGQDSQLLERFQRGAHAEAVLRIDVEIISRIYCSKRRIAVKG